jgi:hypothetical protein
MRGLAGCDAHPHWKFQSPLRCDCGVDRRTRRGEHRAHPVVGVVEHLTRVRLDRFAQYLIVFLQR